MRKIFTILILIGIIFIVNQAKFESPLAKKVSINEIKSENSLDNQVRLYQKLIEKVGPLEAQEQLYKSGLPFDGQSHLLNHAVGDYLYEKYGPSGLAFCKDYFLSSCYHGFVIRAVGDRGVDVLTEVMDRCWQKGGHVAIQCGHSIGHGFLAWVGYKNLLQALILCDEMAQKSQNFPVYNCHDGVFMENIWAIHDGGERSPFAWLKDDNPIYPCNEPKIPYRYIRACWSNQPTISYRFFGGDLIKAGEICIGVEDTDHKQTCFDGLARQIHPLTKGSIDETFRMCSLMPSEWVDPCIISITKAFFSVGDREVPYQICNRINPLSKDRCFSELIGIIKGYATNEKDKREWCRKISNQIWASNCLVN